MKGNALIMKTGMSIIVFAVSALLAASLPAQDEFTYEGTLKTAQGLPLSPGSYGAAIRIYDAAAGGNLLWSGSTAFTTDLNGRFAVPVGDVSCSAVEGDSPAYTNLVDAFRAEGVVRWYIGVSVSGGDEISPRQEIVCVPLASRATTVPYARGDVSGAKLSADELTVQVGFSTEGRVVSPGRVESDYGSTASILGGLTVSGGSLAVRGGMNVSGATIRAKEASGYGIVPKGAIVALAPGRAVPDGWALCDGTNDTPDLSGRFIYGCGGDGERGAEGGEAAHRLTIDEVPGHSHTVTYHVAKITDRAYKCGDDDGDDDDKAWADADKGHCYRDFTSKSWGGGGLHENRPPYRALRYIMKK